MSVKAEVLEYFPFSALYLSWWRRM